MTNLKQHIKERITDAFPSSLKHRAVYRDLKSDDKSGFVDFYVAHRSSIDLDGLSDMLDLSEIEFSIQKDGDTVRVQIPVRDGYVKEFLRN